MKHFGKTFSVGLVMVLGFLLGYPMDVSAEVVEESVESAYVPIDLTGTEIKEGFYINQGQTVPAGQEGAFEVSLVEGKEYIFIVTNAAAFELRDPNGEVVKSFDATPVRKNRDALFEYKSLESGTYTVWSDEYSSANTFEMWLFELFDPTSLSDMGQIYAQGNRRFYVKSDVNNPYTLSPQASMGSSNYVYLTPKDIVMNNVSTGEYRRANSMSMNILRSLKNGVNGPYLLYAPKEVRYQAFELSSMRGLYIHFRAQSFTPKTGDFIKEYVTELNAEDRDLSMVADPVDAFGGNFVDKRTLMSYGGSNPLSFEMNYDSIANNSIALRTGFSHNFETYIEETELGVDVYWSPSSVVRFELVDGEYRAVQDKHSEIKVSKTASGYSVIDQQQQEFQFNLSGKISTFVNKVGHQTSYTYDGDKLIKVENSQGQWFTFTYDYKGLLIGVTDKNDRKISFSYGMNRLDTVTMPNASKLKIDYHYVPSSESYKVSRLTYDNVILVDNVYDLRGRVLEQLDGNNNKTVFTYDEHSRNDRVVTTIDTNGRKEVLTHDVLGNLLKRTDGRGYSETHTYDTHRNRVSTKNKNGHMFNYGYDARNRLVSVKNPDGTTLEHAYDDRNNLTTSVMADGESISNAYDEQGRLVESTDRAGNVITYTYDDAGNLAQLARVGYVIDYTYDENGYVETLAINDGPLTTFENDALGRVVKTTLPDGTFMETAYDVNNNVLSTTDQKGQKQSFTYNAFGNVLTETDRKGTVTTHTYDANGNRLTSKTGDRQVKMTYNAFNQVTETAQVVSGTALNKQTFTYNNRGELTATKDADGKGTTTTYDGNGNVLTTKVGESVVTNTYDVMGNRTAVTDAYGNKTTFTYDKVGNLLTQTTPDGSVLTYTYDKMGRILATTDAVGNETTYEYDIRGNLLTSTDAKGAVMAYEYNDNNQPTVVVNALGEQQVNVYNVLGQLVEVKNNRDETVLSYEYDALGQLIKTTDGNGHTSELTYDANGNVLTVTDALGHVIETSAYNAYNEVVASTDGLGNESTMTYDGMGNISSVVDARDNTTTIHYTAANRTAGSTDPLDTRMEYTYDVYGQIATIGEGEDPNQKFTRDLNQNLIQEQFGASTLKYGYNAEQELVKRTNARGSDLTYEYDANGRVVKETSPEGAVSYEYDAVGNVLVVESEESRIERAYDLLGRVISKTQDGQTIEYEYDDRGHLVKMVYPNGKTVSYTYDVVGNLLTVTDWNDRVTSYEYDANNRLIHTVNANGTEELRTYDAKGQVLTLVNKKGSDVLSQYSYEYDANGNIVQENDFVLKYDQLNRLTGAGENTYAYSPLGNITAVNGAINQSMTYGEDNELLSVNDVSTSVDADGNLTQYTLNDETFDAVYDSKNQLTSFDGVAYQYDAEANRIGVTDGDVVTSFVVDNDSSSLSRLLVETTGDESIYYVYGNGLIGSYQTDGSYDTYEYDYRGSVVGVTNEVGAVVGEVSYDEYGVILEKDESIDSRFLYNGKYGVQTDSNGLYHMRARYYNPDLKRFMNRDVVVGTVEQSQTLNRYAYVNGNPISYHDPFGLAREMLSNVGSSLFTKDGLHLGLDALGLIPGFGIVPDALNTALYLIEGDYGNALASGVAMVPVAGVASVVFKHMDTLTDWAKVLFRHGDEVAEVAVEGYTKLNKATSGDSIGVMLRNKPVMPEVDEYRILRKNKDIPGQAHHLNQDAAYRERIPKNQGLTVKLEGNAFSEVGSSHYNAHESLEGFWNQYRRGGSKEGAFPTNAEYTEALVESLKSAGYTSEQAAFAADKAVKQRMQYGLMDDDFVPRLPGRINQTKR